MTLRDWGERSLGTVERTQRRNEVFAGLSLAAVGLPAVLGYSLIARMPIVTGFYTFIVPMAIFALVGSSRHLIVAGDSASAALLAAGLAGLAVPGSRGYVVDAEIVAVLVGVTLILVRVLRLDFVSNFLSRTILVGFMAGVGVSIIVAEVPATLGMRLSGEGPTLSVAWHTLAHVGTLTPLSAALGVTSLVAILVLRRWPSVPGGFLVVSTGTVVGWIVVRQGITLSTVAAVHSSLPHPVFGRVPSGQFSRLIETALSIVVVVIAQSAATSRGFAARFSERVDEGRDLIGLGVANLAAGLSGTYPVNSSPTRAAIAVDSGSRTQWSTLVAAGVSVIVLLFFTGPLRDLPTAVLSGLVLSIAIRIIDVVELRRIARLRVDEAVVAGASALAVVVLGIEYGILVSMGLAVINHLRRGYAPRNFLVVLDEEGNWASREVSSREALDEGLFVYRFQASLWYANVGRLVEEVESFAAGAHTICFDMTSVAAVDYSAGTTLAQFIGELEGRGVTVRFSHLDEGVIVQLESYGLLSTGDARVARGTRDVIAEYRSREP